MKQVVILCILISLLFSNCIEYGDSKSEIVYLIQKDTSQVITVFSDYSTKRRIVAVGRHNSIPQESIILLDISEIPELGDELGVCWNTNENGWELVNDKATVIENKLDSSKYVFQKSWPRDEKNIPTPIYYWKDNCFTVGMSSHSKPKPEENGFVKRGRQ